MFCISFDINELEKEQSLRLQKLDTLRDYYLVDGDTLSVDAGDTPVLNMSDPDQWDELYGVGTGRGKTSTNTSTTITCPHCDKCVYNNVPVGKVDCVVMSMGSGRKNKPAGSSGVGGVLQEEAAGG